MFKAVSASPFRDHLRSTGNIYPHCAKGTDTLTGGQVDGIHESINEHCHSFAFVFLMLYVMAYQGVANN